MIKQVTFKFDKINHDEYIVSIINDKNCMSGTAKSIKNSIVLSKRKQTKKEFIIQVNLNNIRTQLKNLE